MWRTRIGECEGSWRRPWARVALSCSRCLSPAKSCRLRGSSCLRGFPFEFGLGCPGRGRWRGGRAGTVFVGTRSNGGVYAVKPGASPESGGQVVAIAHGLNSPNGVAVRDGALFVAEISRILRFDDIEAHLDAPLPPKVVYDKLPNDAHHGWKFIAFGPDGWLYVPVGAPCNVCESATEPSTPRSTACSPTARGIEVFARGIRNTVGFDWHPEHARALVHRQRPRLPRRRPAARRAESRAARRACTSASRTATAARSCRSRVRRTRASVLATSMPPASELGAARRRARHALLHRHACFPERYRDAIFIAEHGSWNRPTQDRLPRRGRAARTAIARSRPSRSRAAGCSGIGAWGPAGRRAGDARRRAARLGRLRERRLPDFLRETVGRRGWRPKSKVQSPKSKGEDEAGRLTGLGRGG